MPKMTARGQITIVDLNDGRTLNLSIEPNKVAKQVKNIDNGSYSPNWSSTDPFILEPHLYVSGEGVADLWGGSSVENRKYYINDTQITATSASTSNPFGCHIQGNKLYFITNMISTSFYNVKVSCEYRDPNTNMNTAASSSISISREDMSGSAITMFMFTDDGDTFNKDVTDGGNDKSTETIDIFAIMYRGGKPDLTDVSYTWYKNGTQVTSSNKGKMKFYTAKEQGGAVVINAETTDISKAAIIRVHRDDVDSFSVIKCEAKDIDTTSGTYNQIVYDSMALYDATDPIQIEIEGSESLTRANPTTYLEAKLYQNGLPIQDSSIYSSSKFGWTMYNSSDTVIKTYNGTSNTWVNASSEAAKTTGLNKNIKVSFTDVNGRCRIVCEAEINL